MRIQNTESRIQKKFISCLCLVLASGFWLLASGFFSECRAGDTDVADSWSMIPKGLGGIFDTTGQWKEYLMADTDASGRGYIDLWLVPGAVVEFKALLDPNGNKKFEKDFATSSGRRQFTVPSANTTLLMNWSDTPDVPIGLTGYSDSGKVTLSWTAPAGDGNLDVVNGGGYYLYYDTGPVFDTWARFSNDTILAKTFVCTGLVNDSPYYFSLRSIDAYWDTGPLVSGPYSDSFQVTPGSPVSVAFRIFMGKLKTDSVYVGLDTGAGWTEYLLKQEGTARIWSDTKALPRGYNLSYKFSFKDTAGNKLYEFPVASGRSHMFIYPHRAGINTLTVKGSWDWGKTTAMSLNPDSFWRADVSIPNGGVYEYGFTINGATWDSDPLNPYKKGGNALIGIDATTHSSTMRNVKLPDTGVLTVFHDWEDTPYAPTGFLAMPNVSNTILLTWTKASLVEDLDSYRIEYSENALDSTAWIPLAIVGPDSASYTHQNIILGDTYYYRIYTVDYSNRTSDWKNYASARATGSKEALFLIRRNEPASKKEPRTMEIVRGGRVRKK